MTREQAQQVASVTTRIHHLRAGGVAENDIRPALFREGWAAAAVRAAFEQEQGNEA